MEIQEQRFYKGVNSDIDRMYLAGDCYIDLVNGDIVPTSEGKYIVRNAQGMKVLFSLASGYSVIGFTVVAGVLYIVSCNGTNTEIGSFPYMNGVIPNYVYTPLQNYKTTPEGGLTAFNTPLFKYTKMTRLSLTGRMTFDGSVNLYLCDGENPNYVVNTGIDQNGVSNGISYSTQSFYGRLRQFMGASKIPQFDQDNSGIQSGGCLKPGTYIFFIRYCDTQYNRTPFLNWSSSFYVADGAGDGTTIHVPFSDNDSAVTGKSVKLYLNNLEQYEYKCIEIAFVRSFGLTDSVSTECKLVSVIYDKGNNTSLSIVVSGREKMSTITLEEIYKKNPQTQACTDHTIINDRYWGVGWKKKKRDSGTKTAEYFRRLIPQSVCSTNDACLKKGIRYDFEQSIGFFEGQIYQIVGQFIYNDLTCSDLYPCAGYENPASPSYNSTGYIRIKTRTLEEFGYPLRLVIASGIKDTNGHFVDPLTGTSYSASEYFNRYKSYDDFKDVIGIRFYRSKRVHNLLYQGIALPTTFRFYEDPVDLYPRGSVYGTYNQINGLSIRDTSYIRFYTTSLEGTKSKYLGKAQTPQSYPGASHYPFYHGIAAGYDTQKNNDLPPWAIRSTTELNTTEKVRMALFSTDFMFSNTSKIFPGQQLYYEEIAGLTETAFTSNDLSDMVYPPFVGAFYNPTSVLATKRSGTVMAYPVDSDIETGTAAGGFISKIRDYFAIGKHKTNLALRARMCYQIDGDSGSIGCLRSNRTAKYIGIELQNETYGVGFEIWKPRYINIYLTPNNAGFYANVIGQKNLTESYISMGGGFNIDDLFYARFGGDCFYGFTNFALNKSFEFGGDDTLGDPDEFKKRYGTTEGGMFQAGYAKFQYHFGTLMRIMTENEIFQNARVITKDATTFDALGYDHNVVADMTNYAKSSAKNVCFESMKNYGGLSSTGLIMEVGGAKIIDEYDSDTFLSGVAFSDRQIGDAVADAFRNITLSKVKTFATSLGGIVAIKEMGGYIFMIHRNGVTIHQSEFIIKQTTDSNPITIAQGEVLPDMYQIVGKFGALCFDACIATENAIYGFDSIKDRPWVIAKAEQSYAQYDLSEMASAKKFFSDIIDFSIANPWSSVQRATVGYDPNRKCVLFSIYGKNNAGITYYYNEELKAFTHRNEFYADHLIGFRNSLLSVPYEFAGAAVNVYQHNSSSISDLQSFHGSKKIFRFVFVINGKGEKDFSRLAKIFDALLFLSPRTPFSTIKFSTENQPGISATFYNESRSDFWNNPTWLENKWCVPIRVQESTRQDVGPLLMSDHPEYQAGSIYGFDPNASQRGTWLEVEVTYGGSGGEKEIFIKSVETHFNVSES